MLVPKPVPVYAASAVWWTDDTWLGMVHVRRDEAGFESLSMCIWRGGFLRLLVSGVDGVALCGGSQGLTPPLMPRCSGLEWSLWWRAVVQPSSVYHAFSYSRYTSNIKARSAFTRVYRVC